MSLAFWWAGLNIIMDKQWQHRTADPPCLGTLDVHVTTQIVFYHFIRDKPITGSLCTSSQPLLESQTKKSPTGPSVSLAHQHFRIYRPQFEISRSGLQAARHLALYASQPRTGSKQYQSWEKICM